MNESARTTVVSAGTAGLTTTFDLAEHGAQIMLFKRGAPGRGLTGCVAGICYDTYAEGIDTAATGNVMDHSRGLSGEGGFAFHGTPYVFLVRESDDVAAAAFEESVGQMRVRDRVASFVRADELGDRFPIRTDDVFLAGVAEGVDWADPATYVDLFAEQYESVGVAFRVDDAVTLRTGPPTIAVDDVVTVCSDAVVVAAGVHSRHLLADAGRPIVLRPYRVQALVAGCGYRGPTVCDATDKSYLRPHPGGVLAGDGVEPVEPDPNDWNLIMGDWFIVDVPDGVRHRTGIDSFDGAGEAAAEADQSDSAWTGLCEATPDRSPPAGAAAEDVYVAAGWHGRGFMWVPAIGERLAETVLGDGREQIPATFDPRRFDGGEELAVVEGVTFDGD